MELLDTVESVLGKKKKGIYTISPDASVYDALVLMAEKEVGALLVMRGNDLVGVISERDYARKIALMGRSSKETDVSEVMSSPPMTVSPRATVTECMQLMTDKRRRHLPVVDNGVVVGIVSIGDLVKWKISEVEAEAEGLKTYIATG